MQAKNAPGPDAQPPLCAGYGMEVTDPVAEEEAAPADHTTIAVIESVPKQLASSSSPPLPQLELSSPLPTMSVLISGLPLPQPAVSSPQLGSPSAPGVLPSPQLPSLPPLSDASFLQIRPSPELCKASPEPTEASPELSGASPQLSGAPLEPLAAIPTQQVCFPEQLQPSPGQRGRSGSSGSSPTAVKGHPTPHMGASAQLTDLLDSLDASEVPLQDSFPGLSFDAYDVLSDLDPEDEDLMAERKAFRAMLRSSRADLSHMPARSGLCDRSTPNVTASTSAGNAPRLGSISTTHGFWAVPRALGRGKGSRPVEVPQPSRSAYMEFAARAKAGGHRAGTAATDPLATEAGVSVPRAEAEGGALGREADAMTTALKTRADASALAEPEGPALVAVPSQQQEQRQPQSEKAEPANSELSGGDSLDSLMGDLPPYDPLSFWQASGNNIWEEAHSLAAQTYEVNNDSDHMGADDAAAAAGGSAVVPSAAAVGADTGTTAVAGPGAAVGCSDAAVTTAALAYSNRDATEQQAASSQAGRSLSASRPPLSVHGSLINTALGSSGTELRADFSEADPAPSSRLHRPHVAVSSTGCAAQSGSEAQSSATVDAVHEPSDQAVLTSLYRTWQTEDSDEVQLGHGSDHVATLHQTECQNRAEEEQWEGGAAETEDAEEEVHEEGELGEEEGGGWVTERPDGVVADTSPNFTAWLAGSMLNRLEADSNNRGGQMGTLGKTPQQITCQIHIHKGILV